MMRRQFLAFALPAREAARSPDRRTRFNHLLSCCAIASVLVAGGNAVFAQSQIILQPANQTAAAPTATTQPAMGDSDLLGAIKSLEEMKAANEEMLKKQQAVLEALDQLQKDADQLRIFAKRG